MCCHSEPLKLEIPEVPFQLPKLPNPWCGHHPPEFLSPLLSHAEASQGRLLHACQMPLCLIDRLSEGPKQASVEALQSSAAEAGLDNVLVYLEQGFEVYTLV